MTIVPMTELEAVNYILKTMSEAPVSTLSGTLDFEVAEAKTYLDESLRSLMTRGWYWNREVVTISPDGSNEIVLPANTLDVRVLAPVAFGLNYTARGGKLYRIQENNNGSTFDSDVKVELVLGLSFDEMPDPARTYCTVNAAGRLHAKDGADGATIQRLQYEEQRAWADLRAAENRNARRSLKNAYSVARISG